MIDVLFVGGPWDKQVRPISVQRNDHLVPLDARRAAVYQFITFTTRGSTVLGFTFKHVGDYER